MAREITVGGKAVKWDVTEQGHFRCEVGGATVREDTLEKMITKARAVAATQKINVSIPVAVIRKRGYSDDHGTVKNVTMIRLHGRTSDVVARDEDGKSVDGISTYDECYQPFAKDEIAEHARLLAAVKAATKALESFLKKRLLPLKAGKLVENAIAAAEKAST